MRIIAGEKKSRKIEAPQGQDTRPTADRIKEALFSILQNRLYDAKVLDLYAGSGALSLEALSRGAKKAVLADKSPKACQVIRRNIETLSYQEKARLLNMEDKKALDVLERERDGFDLIFLDPPYKLDMTEICRRLGEKLLNKDGVIICEHDKKTPPQTPENLTLTDRREYGITGLSFFKRKEDGNEETHCDVPRQL